MTMKSSKVTPGEPNKAEYHNMIVADLAQLDQQMSSLDGTITRQNHGMANNGRGVSSASAGPDTLLGGRQFEMAAGFMLRVCKKEENKWIAYFSPGLVTEDKEGESTTHPAYIGEQDMSTVPYPGLEVKEEGGDLWLKIERSGSDFVKATLTMDTPDGNTATNTVSDGDNLWFKLGLFSKDASGNIGYGHYHVGGVLLARGGGGGPWQVSVAKDDHDAWLVKISKNKGWYIDVFGHRVENNIADQWEDTITQGSDICVYIEHGYGVFSDSAVDLAYKTGETTLETVQTPPDGFDGRGVSRTILALVHWVNDSPVVTQLVRGNIKTAMFAYNLNNVWYMVQGGDIATAYTTT